MSTASELAHLFRALKAPAAGRTLPKLADRARVEDWSYEQFAQTLLETEVSARDSHGDEARIRQARFRLAGHRFATATEWVARLSDAKRDGRLEDELAALGRIRLLVVDLGRYRHSRDIGLLVNAPEFPLRMSMTSAEIAINVRHGADGARFVRDLGGRSTDKLRFHGIKVWLDGSYQAMSLRVNYPGYLDGGNGLHGEVPWADLADRMLPYWERGIQIHAHANGDEAIDAALDTLAELQRRHPGSTTDSRSSTT